MLVDGRRHVAGLPGSASVDISAIPKDLIDRIDVLTGGASAVYGADGVSGVVNFVLKRDFEGISVTGQTGISEQGDAPNQYGALTVGKNFADGRGNVVLSYEYTNDGRVNSFDRPRNGDPLKSFSFVQDPTDFPDDPNVPDRTLRNDLRYADSSRDGAIDVDFDGVPDFTGSGKVYDGGLFLPNSGFLTQGGDSTPIAGYQGDLQPDNRIHNINVLSSFEFNDALRVFAQGKYTDTHSFTIAQPSFDFFTYLQPDNAYLIQRFGDQAPDGALVSRDNFDLGVRGETTSRETLRGVIGADGRITDNATYELSYTYGQTKSRFFNSNYRIGDRYFAALDAVDEGQFLTGVANGNIVCRSDLAPAGNIDPDNFDQPATTFTPGRNSGCSPLNVLGENVRTQASLDFINANLLNTYKVTQNVVSGSVSGDFGQFFSLPGGPIEFAFGGEYRKETSDFVSDPLEQQGALADLAQITPESGSFNVKEGFAELNAPLLKNTRFAELLSFGAAIRLSDYSTVGGTTTWAVNGIYAPIRDIRFRATYSEAVRAPNITELFAPTNGAFSFYDDSCDPINIPEGTEFRQANCNAILTGLGIDPATFAPTDDPAASASLPGRSGGNRNLNEETARTWTAGVVVRPSFIRGLNISADWFDIRLRNAVSTASLQDLGDLCVDQPTIDNQFCANITRDPDTGFVTDYFLQPQNVAAFETAGLDVQLDYLYQISPSLGSLAFAFRGSYLDKLTFISSPGADVDDQKRDAFAPEYSGNADLTWNLPDVSINYGINFFSKTRRFSVEQIRANPDIVEKQYYFFKDRFQHDVRVAFDVADRFSFYSGVNNLFDQQPDVGSATYPADFRGRFFYAGARIKLDKLF